MRRSFLVTTVVAALVVGAAGGAWGATGMRKMLEVEYRGMAIKVDGKTLQTDSEPFLVVEQGRTFVPARVVAEALGAKVGWDADSNSVLIYTPNFVDAKLDNGLITWTSPYWGIRMQTPPGMVRVPDNNYMLAVTKTDGSLYIGAKPIVVTDATVPLSGYYQGVLKAFSTAFANVNVKSQQDATVVGQPASTAVVELTAGQTAMQAQVTAVRTDKVVWLFMINAPKGAWDQATVDQFFGSLSFGGK